MRRRDLGRVLTTWTLAMVSSGLIIGILWRGDGERPAAASEPDGNSKSSTKTKKWKAKPKVDETISDLAYVVRSTEVPVEGVGLVVNLEGTGYDPPPLTYRRRLLEDMRKAGIDRPDKFLATGNTAMVIVRTRIPNGIGPKDNLDVELTPPPGSTLTSMAGGWLINTRLYEVGVNHSGLDHQGKYFAWAGGPVMTGTATKPNDLKSGRVLAGGHVRKEMPYLLVIKPGHQSGWVSARIEAIIRERFHQRRGVNLAGVATAKTDKHLEISVPRLYHQNPTRFFEIIKVLPTNDSEALCAERLERWGKELVDVKTAGTAALKLEGMGKNAAATLKTGLTSPDPQVRFFAAEALAYLNDEAGIKVLANTAAELPLLRPFALVALASMDHPAAILRLRDLMDNPDPKVRYGAFDVLRKQDPNDGFLGRVTLFDEPTPKLEEGDEAMAASIVAATRRRRSRTADPFALYMVDSEGPPLIHVSRTRRSEIVFFGTKQQLQTPLVLGRFGQLFAQCRRRRRRDRDQPNRHRLRRPVEPQGLDLAGTVGSRQATRPDGRRLPRNPVDPDRSRQEAQSFEHLGRRRCARARRRQVPPAPDDRSRGFSQERFGLGQGQFGKIFRPLASVRLASRQVALRKKCLGPLGTAEPAGTEPFQTGRNGQDNVESRVSTGSFLSTPSLLSIPFGARRSRSDLKSHAAPFEK